MTIDLSEGWKILQDVHDDGEALGVWREGDVCHEAQGDQLSDWEDLPKLEHLQLIYARNPYFGRDLRYFNQAPWWYRRIFELPDQPGHVALHFTNADYYCKVWLNGILLGEHEGYSSPFTLDATQAAQSGKNILIVKVWSPWDESVAGSALDKRTFNVERRMVKGTYEHSDTFIQRDVNPVGLYGKVSVECESGARFEGTPSLAYSLDEQLKSAHIRVRVSVKGAPDTSELRLTCVDRQTGERLCEALSPAVLGEVQVHAAGIRLWNSWDRGGAWLYTLRLELVCAGKLLSAHEWVTGFRKADLIRDAQRMEFHLNGRRIYVRGTSYFPDAYISNMTEEKYLRDLMNIRMLGFNLIRVHVHVEQSRFYELCDELGLLVIQDSEYNWTHPSDTVFWERFERVMLDTVRFLGHHPSIACWILMNEPNLMQGGLSKEQSMALYGAVRAADPSRPVIRGSFVKDDTLSGDSHNYTGSLNGSSGHFVDIFGTTEKLNTEYGFDAPPTMDSLRRCPEAAKRLAPIADRIPEIQRYQYALLKYYTEHYRMQKYVPNAGYVQFLYSDLCPQSFYGLYDHWGLPKLGARAMIESNQPVGVFLRYDREHADSVWVVNDNLEPLGNVRVRWVCTDGCGDLIVQGSADLFLGSDRTVSVALDLRAHDGRRMDVALILTRGDEVIAQNRYEDLFSMPSHVKGHPERMTHELGMRLYFS